MTYYLTTKDIDKAADIFAASFQNDPLYIYLAPDEKERKVLLPLFFKHYLKLMTPYSYLVADSADLNALALWYDDSKVESPFKWKMDVIKSILLGFEACHYISFKSYITKLKTLSKMSSSWIDAYQQRYAWHNYIHLDMLVVDPTQRGKGFAHQLMIDGLETFLSPSIPSTIETHNKINVAYYERYGYQLVETITLPKSNLTQYCMIRTHT